MLDLRKVEECQRSWRIQNTTIQNAGKPMNCTSESWYLIPCSFFSNGNTSLLFASDTLVITQAPFDYKVQSFTNLTGIWSFNASQELSSTFSVQASRLTAKLTKYGLFGFNDDNSNWLYNIDGASNTSTRVGFCLEDQEPYVSYRDVAGNTLWSPQNATRYTNGTPPLLYTSGPFIYTGYVSSAAPWVGVTFGILALMCIVIVVLSSRKKSVPSNAVHTSANSFAMNPRSLNRSGDQEGLPLYAEHETGSSVASLNSTVHTAFPQGASAAQDVAARRGMPGWTIDDVVAWVRLNVGNDSLEEVVRKEKIDGSVIETLDVDDILNAFTFASKAERESMRNAFMSLKSRNA
ncbi:hypothetical protein HDU78_002349 [Chytriomyces hyalinus]|nr:hypothetical protein HDU78_002349 [Chytriomyces hyalinus]